MINHFFLISGTKKKKLHEANGAAESYDGLDQMRLSSAEDSRAYGGQPLGRVVPTQFLDEFFGATRDVPRKVDGVDTLQEKNPITCW